MHYSRLVTRLYNTPLAISQCKLDILTSEVTIKLLSGQPLETVARPERSLPREKTSIIRVFDTLVSKNGAGDSGSTSYESITAQIKNAISEGATDLHFYIDSPGGEVSGLFGLANFIASLPKDYGISTKAFTDGMMTSAAYVLGAAAQETYATASSIVGSIGALMTLINTTEKDTKDGIKYTILRSKEEKALLNPHEPFSNSALEDAMAKLRAIDTIMNESINRYRPQVSIEKIQGLKGASIMAEEALSYNLIDGIVSSIEDIINPINTPSSTYNTGNVTMTLEEALSKNLALQAELDQYKANASLDKAKVRLEEQTRCVGILEAASTFGLSMAHATKRIKAGTSVDETVSLFEDIKEAMQKETHIDTTQGITETATQGAAMGGPARSTYVGSLMQGLEALSKQPQMELR